MAEAADFRYRYFGSPSSELIIHEGEGRYRLETPNLPAAEKASFLWHCYSVNRSFYGTDAGNGHKETLVAQFRVYLEEGQYVIRRHTNLTPEQIAHLDSKEKKVKWTFIAGGVAMAATVALSYYVGGMYAVPLGGWGGWKVFESIGTLGYQIYADPILPINLFGRKGVYEITCAAIRKAEA